MEFTPAVLIADDDPGVVDLLRVYLRPLGVRVLTASDGEEALRIAQVEVPEIVLLDVLMPKKSGWEVCQALKGVQRTAHECVVLITGKGDVKDRLTGLQVGADDYLVKPFDRDEVIKRLRPLIERARAERRERPSPTDSLQNLLHDRASGMPTVPVVLDKAKELLIEQGEIGVIHIDIEQFESIEQEYGWAFFDEVIRKVGDVIALEAREKWGDAVTACSRVGGSSFYVFVPMRTHHEGVDKMAQALHDRLISSLRERFPRVQAGQIGFFVGATTVEYRPQIRLERQIYLGMQRAADAVRTAEQQRKRQLSRELKDIIRRKRVTTLFQPIVRSADRSIFGYEILTRGPKQSSFRNSDMLFSFARDNGLLWDLEALALESSLNRLRSIDLGKEKFLINLEAEMFDISEFKFHEMVDFFSQNRGRFVMELTERAAIEDYAEFRRSIEEFRAKGMEIAIDDAGSGYASLEAIASLAPDYLKITKGLISTLGTEPIKQDLVKMLVELAHRINAKTIAEGIETPEEYEWCQKLGIDLLQGYYIAYPQETFIRQIPHPISVAETR
jgi:EAL domain-containing protein (putative c-di-GMP-specific phosphodiesterase class I)/DNA-binding response OmpR family regulator